MGVQKQDTLGECSGSELCNAMVFVRCCVMIICQLSTGR